MSDVPRSWSGNQHPAREVPLRKAQLIAALNTQYDVNRALAARAMRNRTAGFIETVAVRRGPALRSFVAEESRRSAA